MLQKNIEKVVEYMIKQQNMSTADAEIYRYGYRLLFEEVLNLTLALLIGIFFQNILGVFLFLVLYIPLRSYCGGWHAGGIGTCTIISNVILILENVSLFYLLPYMKWEVITGILLICALLVWFLSPVETRTKPISITERRAYRKKIGIMVGIHLILFGTLLWCDRIKEGFILAFVYIVQFLMLFLGRIVNNIQNRVQRKKDTGKNVRR